MTSFTIGQDLPVNADGMGMGMVESDNDDSKMCCTVG